jgi:hypothetical protein|tara:strand:+ start:107 stop:1294 length:1188 start_codon:yes stop_codon:yes gene_type:complete
MNISTSKLRLSYLFLTSLTILFIFFSCDDGEDGFDGQNGQDGFNSIILTQLEPNGSNCENGGIELNYGLDLNRNNILEENEIENTEYICNGIDGLNGFNSLIVSEEENQGANCENGGIKISYGMDVNRNNVLETNEIENSYYICNGIDGTNGENAITSTEVEPIGSNCQNGGIKINYGLDLNGNNLLDNDEISGSYYVCNGDNGTNGINSLISTEVETSGINCQFGGIKINYGLDLNSNGLLENSEIQNSEYLCNNDDGTFVINNLDNLIKLELGSPNVTSCGTNWFISQYDTFHFPDFNKLDYSNVSSIEFVPSMVSQSSGNTVTVELFNMTDNVPIANSQVQHNTNEYVFNYSQDIYNELPDYPITLGIRMKNSGVSNCGGLGIKSYLYIRRN